MALRFPGRVKAQTSTTGTGTYTLAEPGQAGWRTFTRAVSDGDLANGDTIPYVVVDTTVTNGPKLLEIGTGTWNNTAKTLARTTIYQPNATAVDWGAGTRDVVVIDNPVLFLLLAGGTMTGALNILISGSIIAAGASLQVQNNGAAGTDCVMTVLSGTSGKSRVAFGDSGDAGIGGVYYDNATNSLVFKVNGSDRVTINSSGVIVNSAGVPYENLPTGTKLVFFQAAAPSGWTKDTTNNDAALRVVSGAGGGTGGTEAVSTANSGSHTLDLNEMPAHTHAMSKLFVNFALGAVATVANVNGDGSGGWTDFTTGSEGGGAGHTHQVRLKYIDVIVCSKN